MKKSLNKVLILLLLLAVAICAMTACNNTQREKSIFEMWLEQGHSGTEADFLEWLRGDNGQDGKDGNDGNDGNNGNDGNDGKDIHGLSAYEIYIKYHPEYKGDERQWIEDYVSGRLVRYNVIFDSLGGSDVQPIKNLEKNSLISMPSSPTRSDYEFNGWYKEENCINQWDFLTDEITKDITLYADWIYIRTQGLVFEPINGKAEYQIAGWGGIIDKEISIPSAHNNKPITSIGENAFYHLKNITKITIPASIKSIETGAFTWCTNLTEVYFEENSKLESIKDSAFIFCNSLSKINIPSGVTTIGKAAFRECFSLESIMLPPNITYIGEEAFRKCSFETILIPAKVTSINNSAFYLSGLKEVEFEPNSKLLYIAPLAFAYSYNLSKIKIASDVTYIGNSAFTSCNLQELSFELGSKLEYIGERAFYGCKFDTIIIPKSVSNIAGSAFACVPLKSISLEGNTNKNYSLIDGVLYNKEETEIVCYPAAKEETSYTIKKNVTRISYYAFAGNKYLKNLNFENGSQLIDIQGYAFYMSENLESVNFLSDNKIEAIGEHAFSYCVRLFDIKIPQGLNSLERYAFAFNPSLKSIEIPFGITDIPDYAFSGCSGLDTITLHDKLKNIGYASFRDTGSISITIPASVEKIGIYAFENSAVKEALFDNDSTCHIDNFAFKNCKQLLSITIPVGLKNYNSYAFDGCNDLIIIYESEVPSASVFYNTAALVIVPDNAVELYKQSWQSLSSKIYGSSVMEENQFIIDNGALLAYFGNSSSVTISGSVTEISAAIFKNQKNLKNIYVNTDNQNYYSDDGVLFNKDKTVLVCFPQGKAASSYQIPSTVKTIAPYAFYDCKQIKNITLPEGLESISGYAFYGCTKLDEIQIPNTVNTIDNCAFSYSGLVSFVIPNSITKLGGAVFEYCYDLTSVTFETGSPLISVGGSLFEGCTNLSSVDFGDCELEAIFSSMFYRCFSLREITIPDTVTNIGYIAFAYSGLEKITIPKAVVNIEIYAFYQCQSLTEIDFENDSRLNAMGEWVFADCINLESITLPASLENLDYTFENFNRESAIKNIYIDKDNQFYSSIDGVLFNKDKTVLICYPGGRTDSTYTIPDGVEYIADFAFWNASLEHIIFPDSLLEIGDYAFYDSSFLSIVIPKSVIRIGKDAFRNCKNLIRVEFEQDSQLALIGSYAFYFCESLYSITIPKGVTKIGRSAFAHCAYLTSITIEGTTENEIITLDDDAFDSCSRLSNIYLPNADTLTAYQDASQWSDFSSLMKCIAENNKLCFLSKLF